SPIVEGNVGDLVVAHPLTDLSSDPHRVKFRMGADDAHVRENYELVLTEIPVKADNCFSSDQTMIFELKLIDHATGAIRVLQADKVLPRSRSCPNAYRIQNVYTYHDR